MNRLNGTLGLFAILACAAGAETIEDRVKSLEEKLAVKEAAATEKPVGGLDVFFKNGLQIKGADGNFEIKIGGRVLVHYREYIANPEKVSIDNFSFREVKLDLKGKIWKDFGFRVEVNGSNNTPFVIDDAYVSFERWSLLRIKVGQFKAPFSLEQNTSTLFIDMPERAPSDRLVPGYELGVSVYGTVIEKILDYNFMIANGTLKAAENNSDKDFHARVQLRPFATLESDLIRGFHAGIAVNWGKRGLARGVLPYNYSAPSTQTTFVAGGPRLAQVRFDEDRYRFCAELAWLAGPLGVKAEYIKTRDTYRFSGAPDSAGHTNHEALFVTASWFITGEEKNWDRPGVRKPLFGPDGGIGAVEILGRYSRFNMPQDLAKDGVTSKLASAQHVDEMALCVNWYPNANVRVSAMYAWIEYNGRRNNPLRLAGRKIDHEDVLLVRLQIDF